MREIKFRAWIKDYALMADVNFLNIDYKEIVVIIDENDYEFGCGEYELMQYTGLKDKNGTEIYEGDIVRYPHIQSFKEKWEVGFCDGGFIIKQDYTSFGIRDLLYRSNLVVIGNTFENPELLEDANN